MFDCQLCQQESRIEATISGGNTNGSDASPQKQNQFSNLSELEAHLASEHFNCLPYECEQCHFAKFPTEFAVIKHNEEDHGNKCYSFRCRITPALKQKRAQIRLYLSKIKNQQNVSSPPPVKKLKQDGDKNNSDSNQIQINEKTKGTQQQEGELAEEVIERNKLKPLSKDSLKKKSFVNNCVGSGDSDCVEDDFVFLNKASSSLTEQLQAACAQNIRHRRAADEKGDSVEDAKTPPNYGGTVSIREGGELSTNLLGKSSGKSTGGNTTDEENEELEGMDDFEESGMMEYGDGQGGKDGDEEDEQIRKQEADVQEILKAAAAATSQIGGGDVAARNTSTPYSLRPNRCTPYAALLGGKQKQSSPPPPRQQTSRPNWQLKLGNSNFGSGGSSNSNNLSLMMNRRERNVERIRCRKCGELVNSTGGCLMHHLNTRHLRLPLFQCKECKKDFYEVSNTRIHKHMRIYHSGDTSNLVSNYAKYSHTLHSGRDNCFGTRDERLREIQRERGLCSSLNLDRNIDLTSFISTATAKTTTTNNGNNNNSRLPPNSSPSRNIGSLPNDSFLRSSISFKQYGYGNNSNKQSTSRHNDLLQPDVLSPHLSGPFNQSVEDLFNGNIKKEICSGDEMLLNNIELNKKKRQNLTEENLEEYEEEEDDEYNEQEEVNNIIGNLFNEELIGGILKQQQKKQNFEAKLNEKYNNNEETTSNDKNTNRNGNNSNNKNTAMKQLVTSLQTQQHYQLMQMEFGSEEKIEEKVPCKVCGQMTVNKQLNRLNHINTRHLHLPLHQCRLCQKSFASYSRSACYSHIQFAHKADLDAGLYSQNIEEHIIYMKEQYRSQLEESANDYFD
uniref:C2H2-type domain-containing protein n=1 Tax=Meloidogyne incognita TaxID=6306 RepID=A0A914MUP0_MELIC